MKASIKTMTRGGMKVFRNTLVIKRNTIVLAPVIVAIFLLCMVTVTHADEIGLVNNPAGTTITVRGYDTLKNDDFHNSGIIIIENTGKLTQTGGIKIDPAGYLNNLGAIVSDGRFYNNGLIDNRGSWTFSNRLVNQDTGAILNNYGSIVAVRNKDNKLKDSQFQVSDGTTVNNYKEGSMTTYYLQNRGTINNYGRWESKYCAEKECYLINKGSGIINNTGTMETEYVISRGNINNKTGGTIINKGDFKSYYSSGLVGKDGAVNNAGTFKNTAGATLTVYNSGVFNNKGLLDNAAGATIENSSSLNNAHGGWIYTSGTLDNKTGGTITNDGYIGVTDSGTLINNSTLNNKGDGGLFVNDSGTLTNNGILTNDGWLYISPNGKIDNNGTLTNNSSGRFRNDGTFNTSTTFINDGLFMGTGTTVGNVVNNGIIAPGNSIGTMTINGNFTSNPGSVYRVEINPAGQSDKLNVSGTAKINGGMVSVLAGSGLYKVGEIYRYNILTAGNVLGTFGGVTSDLAFLTPSLGYDPTNVWLTMTRNSTNFCDVAVNSNQASLGCTLDNTHTSPDMVNVINALLGLNALQARNAYDQMSGYIHIAMMEATSYSFSRYVNTLSGRMEGFGMGGASFADTSNMLLASRDDMGSDAGNLLVAAINSVKNNGMAGGDLKSVSPWGLWAKGYGNLGDRHGDEISSKYDYRGGGLVIGFDRKISERFLLGVSTGYSYNRLDMKELSENGNVSSYQGSIYGAYNSGPLYVHGVIGYGYNHYDTTRNISFGDIARSANGDYAASSLNGYVETGYRLPIDSVSLVPMVSLQAGSLWRNSFTETNAGALNLDVENEHASFLIGSLGFKLKKEFKLQGGAITPELRVRWLHEFANNEYSMNAVFASDPVAPFTVRGEGAKRDSAVVGLGLSWQIGRNLGFAMSYDANISSDRIEHGGMIGVRYIW